LLIVVVVSVMLLVMLLVHLYIPVLLLDEQSVKLLDELLALV
jgi:hypothetical protein